MMTFHSQQNERSQQLSRLEAARQALMFANSLEQIKAIRERVESIRVYAQATSLGLEVQNVAAELKLQAERVGGRMLATLKMRGGDRRSGSGAFPITLRELGIDKNQSARWQLVASVPESVFREFIQQAHMAGQEISAAGLLRLAKLQRQAPSSWTSPRTDRDIPAVSIQSHILAFEWPSLDRVGRDVDELAETIGEAREHYQLLKNLVASLCHRVSLTADSLDYRALSRYQTEIDRHLRTLAEGLQRLARHPDLNGNNNGHFQSI